MYDEEEGRRRASIVAARVRDAEEKLGLSVATAAGAVAKLRERTPYRSHGTPTARCGSVRVKRRVSRLCPPRG